MAFWFLKGQFMDHPMTLSWLLIWWWQKWCSWHTIEEHIPAQFIRIFWTQVHQPLSCHGQPFCMLDVVVQLSCCSSINRHIFPVVSLRVGWPHHLPHPNLTLPTWGGGLTVYSSVVMWCDIFPAVSSLATGTAWGFLTLHITDQKDEAWSPSSPIYLCVTGIRKPDPAWPITLQDVRIG